METPGVIGREEERAAIRAWVASSARAPSVLLISGEPGIGKTTLWEASVADASAGGYRVLTHRSAQAEAGLSFVGLADLVGPLLSEVTDVLAPPRRRALEVALLLSDPGGDPPDVRAIGMALLDVLQALTREHPAVVALDDLQWLDPSSAAALGIALRRLREQPVGVVATLRSEAGVQPPFDLERTVVGGVVRTLRLGPLRMTELHRLLADRLQLELSRPQLLQILEWSGGNPFLACELGRELTRQGTRSPVAQAAPVPQSLRELLGGRLGRLPERTADVLLAAAALARPTVPMIAVACGGEERTLRELEVAAREGVLELDGSSVRFTHPLLASLCYERSPAWRRRAVHARLATAMTEIEQRARHVALSTDGPDATVAAVLDDAAEHSAARGATAAAAQLAEMAVDRTPRAEQAERRRRSFAAARFHHLSGDFARACEVYDELTTELPPGVHRADALYARSILGRDDLPTRLRLGEQALDEAADDDGRSAQILGLVALMRWGLGDLAGGLRDARSGLARSERHGDQGVLAVGLARVGLLETWALDITPGLLERGVAVERGLSQPLLFMDSPAFMLTQRLYETDGLDRSRAMLEDMARLALERGDEHTRQWVVLQLVIVEWYAGRWRRAAEHGGTAREIAEQTGEAQFGGMLGRVISVVEAGLGRLDQARRSAEEGLRISQSVGDEIFTIGNLASLGHIELAAGNLRAAGGYLRELPLRQSQSGHRSSLISCWADTIETLVALGELERARSYHREYEEIATLSNRSARVGCARCAALLAAAEGDHELALLACERALAADEPPMYPFERARTLLVLGTIQRRALQRRAARETLDEATALFDELGAVPWLAKTGDELGRISGRRVQVHELTDAERRVAELAAAGRHNKEIAAELFIAVTTVEAHLSRVYRKVGVRSRTELAGRLTQADGGAPKL